MKYAEICTMDAQGRIVIPTKIRRLLSLVNRDSLEVELAGQEIRLRKCGDVPFSTQRLSTILTILYNTSRHTVVLCSETQVIAAVGSFLPDGTPVTEELSGFIKAGKEHFPEVENPLYLSDRSEIPVAVLIPLHAQKPLSLAILSKAPLTEAETACARLAAAMIKQEFI